MAIDKPLITVGVPAYKVERYLTQCVESILRQTYENIEVLLIIRNKDSDKSEKMCFAYAEKDYRCRVVVQKSVGLADARNACIEASEGEYLTFVDADDWVDKDYVAYLWELLNSTGSELSVCGTFMEPSGKSLGYKGDSHVVLTRREALSEMLYQQRLETSAWGKLYRMADLRKVEYPTGELYEDLATTYKVIWLTSLVAVGSRSLYHYRYRNDSLMNESFSEKRFFELDIVDEICRFVSKDCPDAMPAALSRKMSCYFQVLLNMPKNCFEEQRQRIWDFLRENRSKVIKDKNIRAKNRYAAALSFLGESFLRHAYKMRGKI